MFYFVFLLLSMESVLARVLDSSCGVVDMEKWNNDQGSLRTEPLSLPVGLVIIQHTVTNTCDTDAECVDIVKQIRTYHLNYLNWTDIGPSFLVGGNGVIYEGAGWNVGAHTVGYNNKSIGISFIGEFRTQTPSEKALQAVKHMLECNIKQNRLSEDYSLIAHNQVSNTESPGAKLAEEIRTWKHWVEQLN